MTDATRLLSYDEIAGLFGIERESARQLVHRKRWMRRKGNDGRTRVEVPEDAIQAHASTGADTGTDTSNSTGPDPSDDTADDTSDLSAVVAILERHTGRLEAELAAARERLSAVEGERDTARATASQVEALRAVLDVERQRVADAQADAARWRDTATAPRGVVAWIASARAALKG